MSMDRKQSEIACFALLLIYLITALGWRWELVQTDWFFGRTRAIQLSYRLRGPEESFFPSAYSGGA
jgi:hypothetical protein